MGQSARENSRIRARGGVYENERALVDQDDASDNPAYGYNMNPGGGGPAPELQAHSKRQRRKLAQIDGHRHRNPSLRVKSKSNLPTARRWSNLSCTHPHVKPKERRGFVTQHIAACCLEKRNSAGNRFWHFTEEGDLEGTRACQSIGDKPPPTQARSYLNVSRRRKAAARGSTCSGAHFVETNEKKV